MQSCYIDIHIHTSENPNKLNDNYDVATLKKKIESISKGNPYIISLTDHNAINKNAYLKLRKEKINFLIGVELHVRNYEGCDPYHCHMIFDIETQKNSNEQLVEEIQALNLKLDELYPNKELEGQDTRIPNMHQILSAFDSYDFLVLPHGGQSHRTFEKSIPRDGTKFDSILERNIYYNMFDGFTARSNKGLESSREYFKRLGINSFMNLLTCTDNYNPSKYPESKSSEDFIPTWMYSSPTFNGLRVALSESQRLEYSNEPTQIWQEKIEKVTLNNENISIDVNLEPGLNVIIGNSSSGKTLFVEALYSKISGKKSDERYDDYSINDTEVNNPSSIKPHYFSQNYILDLIKKDDSGNDNNLGKNELLKQIFPLKKEFEIDINNKQKEFNTVLESLIDNVKNIQQSKNSLDTIPNFTKLVLEEEFCNPIEIFKPTEIQHNKLDYTSKNYQEDLKKIDLVGKIPDEIFFCESFEEEINSIKEKLRKAYCEISFSSKIENIISDYSRKIDDELRELNSKSLTIRTNRNKMLVEIKRYYENLKKFYINLNTICSYNYSVETQSIESAGHALYLKNKFRLSSDKVTEVFKKYLKDKISNANDLKPDNLFESNFKLKPKVTDFMDFLNKVKLDISSENKVSYEILYNGKTDFNRLSPGMKSSVILDIILGYDKDQAPLIIDQPEDNLATDYINHGLINAIKKSKSNRQIIIVSHNATIPMLGDAQNIILCENNGKKIVITSHKMEEKYRDIDITDYIANLTDGGKSAIKKRFKKYNLRSFKEEQNEN